MTDEEVRPAVEATVGTRLYIRLREMGMTQRELAKRVGVTQASMCRYVRGNRAPKAGALAAMAAELGTTVDWLLGYDDNAANIVQYAKAKALVIGSMGDWTDGQKLELATRLLQDTQKTAEEKNE